MYIQFNKIKKYQLFTISHTQFEEGWIKNMISTKENANVKCLLGNLLSLGETYYVIDSKKLLKH